MFRQNIYLSNLVKISKHNSENYTWTMGVNNFTDLTSSEFKDYYAGCFHKRSEYETDKNIYKFNIDPMIKRDSIIFFLYNRTIELQNNVVGAKYPNQSKMYTTLNISIYI